VFASLGNEIRLKCLYLAARHGEVCVCEAVDALEVPQPTVSKAFKALKDAGFVADRRDANWTHYRINEDMPAWMADVVRATVSEVSGYDSYRALGDNFTRSKDKSTNVC
jgi:ArsR family transcriptional regulator